MNIIYTADSLLDDDTTCGHNTHPTLTLLDEDTT